MHIEAHVDILGLSQTSAAERSPTHARYLHFQHACSFIPRQDVLSSSPFILIREQELSFLKLIAALPLTSIEDKVASWLKGMKPVFLEQQFLFFLASTNND